MDTPQVEAPVSSISDDAIVVTGGEVTSTPAVETPSVGSPETPPAGEGTTQAGEEGETQSAEEAAAKKAKATDRLNKRFSELTRTIHEERAARAAAETRLRELEARGGNVPPPPPASEAEAAPVLENFQTYEEYADARAQWVARREFQSQMRARNEAMARESATNRAIEIRANWETAEATFKGTVDDYDEVMADPSVKFTESVSLALLDSDKGPELAYYLKKHPDEAQALSQASPVAAARMIGRLEAKLTAAPPPPASVTRTPPPPTPVRPASRGDDLTDNLPVGEWIQRRNQQILNRRK